MLIFVYGADTFRSRQKVRELVAAFRNKFDPSGVSVTRLDTTTSGVDELRGAISSGGLFTSRRLIVVTGLLTKKHAKEEDEAIAECLSHHAPEAVVILRDDLPSEKVGVHPLHKKFATRPKSEVVSYAHNPLTARELRSWLNDELHRRELIIEPAALELLVTSGNDLWKLSADLDKLAAYAAGRPVLARDVQLLVRRPVEENIFNCMDAVAGRDLPRAAALLRAERSAGVEDAQLFTMLVRQFRLLLTVKSFDDAGRAPPAALARTLGLHPFVAGKLASQARGFAVTDIRQHFSRLFSLERDIKTGRLTHEAAVDMFLGSLAG